MTSDVAGLLSDRAALVGLEIPDALAAHLLTYYDLLVRWNRKINLTSLSDPAAAVDRLLLEPVLAARRLPRSPELMDLGSGGGSPAIPLALALDAPRLVMVESRTRKAAFLREAARTVSLNAVVEIARFEDLARRADYRQSMDLVSVRAVRMDDVMLSSARQFTRTGGVIALFTSEELPGGEMSPLLGRSKLVRFSVPRETAE